MRYFLLVFLFIFSLNVAAQSPTVATLFSNGAKQANAGHFDEALKSFKTTLFMAENEYLSAAYRARIHYNIGVCYFRSDRFDPATDHFKAALLLKADYARAHYALGMAEMRKRDSDAAANSFSRVLKLDPKNGEAWFDLAFARLARNDLRSAEIAFAKSIEYASVDSPLSYNNIGVILGLKGDLAGAERSFETAIAMSGDRLPEAKHNLEFCRSKHARAPNLIAADFRLATRNVGLALS